MYVIKSDIAGYYAGGGRAVSNIEDAKLYKTRIKAEVELRSLSHGIIIPVIILEKP